MIPEIKIVGVDVVVAQESLTFSPLSPIPLKMYSNKAMALSDMDATYFELEQAALERSLQSYSNQEQGKKQQASSGRRRRNGRCLSNEASVAEESATASAQHPSANVCCKSYFYCFPWMLFFLCLTFLLVTERCCFPSKHF